MRTRDILALLAAAALAAGCGGSRRSKDRFEMGGEPWNRPVQPPAERPVGQGFATGTVTSVSEDGQTLEIEIDRGTAAEGDPVTVVLTVPYASPRNFSDEIRERRVATARVLKVDARRRTVQVEIVPDPRNTRVMPGDKATIQNL